MTDPVNYQPVLPVEPGGRPGSVTAVAVVAIVLGALGLLCKPMSLSVYVMPIPAGTNPMIDKMKADQAMFIYTLASVAVGTMLSLVLLVCGIGLLTLKEWARQGIIVWCAITLLVDLAAQVVNFMWYLPHLKALVGNQPGVSQSVGMVGGIVIWLLLGVALPVVGIYVLTRPKVKEVFARGARAVV